MEIRLAKVIAVGRIVGDPVARKDGIHFQLQATRKGPPFHCVCVGNSAPSFQRFRAAGDEVTIKGTLEYVQFGPKRKLVIQANFVSYGRKQESLQPGDIRGGISF